MRTYNERLANIRAKADANKKAKRAIAATVATLSILALMVCAAVFSPIFRSEPQHNDDPVLQRPTQASQMNEDPVVTHPSAPTLPTPTAPTVMEPLPSGTIPNVQEPTEPAEPEIVVHAYLVEETMQTGSGKPKVTTYERDEFGKLIRKSSTMIEYTAVYNEQGQLEQMQFENGKIIYTYDSYGNLIREESLVSGTQTGLEEYAYFYNTMGRVTAKTYIQKTTQYRIEFTYYDNGKIAKQSNYSDGVLTDEYSYTEAGWLDKYVKYNASTGDKVYSETYHHSETTSKAKRVNTDREVLASITCTYDAYGNVVKKTIQDSDKTVTTYTYTYMYVEEDLGIRVDYNALVNSGSGVTEAEEMLVIRSREELIERFGSLSDLYSMDICSRYTSEFFERNTLLYVVFSEFTGMARHQVTDLRKDEDGNYRIMIDHVYPEWGTEDVGHGRILIEVKEKIPAEASVWTESTPRYLTNAAWNLLYGNAVEEETQVILPQRPGDYELEFWIGEDVTDVDWSKRACYMDGETVDIYMGNGYYWHTDDRGNKFFPVAYVHYKVETLTDGRKFITEITIADPDIKINGVSMYSTAGKFQSVFGGSGYVVEQYGSSNGVHSAKKVGVTFLHHYYEKIVISVDNLSFTEQQAAIPPERPSDTNLEFWLGQDVADVDFSSHVEVNGWFGVREYLGSGYQSTEESYVSYLVGAFPDESDGGSYVRSIMIYDPDVVLYGLSIHSDAGEFEAVFTGMGYDVSETNGTYVAKKNGITFTFRQGEHLIITASVTNRDGIIY